MEINYCNGCTKRIGPGDEVTGADGQRYHRACAPQTAVPAPAPAPHGRPKSGAHPHSHQQAHAHPQPPPQPVPIAKQTALITKKERASARPATQPQKSAPLPWIIGAVGLLALAGAIAFAMSGRSTKKAGGAANTTPPPPTAKSTPENTPAPNTATPANGNKPDSQTPAVVKADEDDPRESYAKQRWAKIQGQVEKLHAYDYRRQVAEFVATYGRTSAGKEAAEKLKQLPEVPAPAAPAAPQASGATKILWSCGFETDAEAAAIQLGTREKMTEGYAAKATPIEGTYFTSRLNLGVTINGQAVPVGPDTWLRFSVKTEGTNTITLHSGINFGAYEKSITGLPEGQWTWVVFKMSDYTRNLPKNDTSTPGPGSSFSGTAIFGVGHGGAKTGLMVDNISLGEGPVPQ